MERRKQIEIRIVDDSVSEKLYNDIKTLVIQSDLTLAEVVGVLELVKNDIIFDSYIEEDE